MRLTVKLAPICGFEVSRLEMTLTEIVEKYRALAIDFGTPVALSDFGFTPAETERIFSQFDEDYHISRFFHFSLDPALQRLPGRTFQINAFPQSHLSLDAEIATIL
jgi:hypothetical protein